MNKPIQQRVKEIPNYFIKRIGIFQFEVRSVNPRNQGEVKYNVFRDRFNQWWCTCPAYMYHKDQTNPTCKHIIRIQNMIKESAKRQALKAQKENSKIDLGDVFN